jgi:hypothetical protein
VIQRQPGLGVSIVTIKGKLYMRLEVAYNLWKIQRVIPNRIEDQVLELIHDSKQVFPECRHAVDLLSGDIA